MRRTGIHLACHFSSARSAALSMKSGVKASGSPPTSTPKMNPCLELEDNLRISNAILTTISRREAPPMRRLPGMDMPTVEARENQ
jgi:hypothetical protein